MRTLTLPPLVALLCGLAWPAAAQDPSPELEILRRVASNYRDASSIWLEGTVEAETKGPSGLRSTEASFRLAIGDRGRIRDELSHPSVGGARVSDGTHTWLYIAGVNQYTRQAAGPNPGEAPPSGMATALLSTLRSLDQGVENVIALPEESIFFQGGLRPCHVLQVLHDPGSAGLAPKVPRLFWIDRQRMVVLKQYTAIRPTARSGRSSVEQRETLTYSRVTLGQPLPDSLFVFRPPQGAKRVDHFDAPSQGEDDLTGHAAIDFTLPDLGGRKHSLKGQRGKVVMLDFWATWCGPCRVQMPLVEKLHQELKNKGLVVYAINQGESAETARRYLSRNKYSTTTLLDASTQVGREYNVAGIPTLVIIDRKGKIAAHYIGVRSEDVLRDALRKAGL